MITICSYISLRLMFGSDWPDALLYASAFTDYYLAESILALVKRKVS